MSTWYIVTTNPRCEQKARSKLSQAGYGVYVPTRKVDVQQRRSKAWSTRTLMLMPGYLFVDMPAGEPDFFTLQSCDGVNGVLGHMDATGENRPWPISSTIVERLIAAQANLEFDDTRAARERRKEDPYPVGSTIMVTDGPFALMTGEVIGMTGQGMIEMLVSILGRLTPVTIPAHQVQREAA